jgi:hypothetical protein
MSREPVIVNSTEALQTAFGKLRNDFMRHKYLRVTWRIGKSRSSKQNRHSHAWYGQLARELPEDDEIGWKSFCKLHFGVPILRADEPDFREMYDEKVKNLAYETKLLLMRWMPVTSLMTKLQLKIYEENVKQHFLARGVVLTYEKEGDHEDA